MNLSLGMMIFCCSGSSTHVHVKRDKGVESDTDPGNREIFLPSFFCLQASSWSL